MWMSEFTEEIPGQIAAGINRLGDDEYTFYSIYPLPVDAEYDEIVYPQEWIQTSGIAPDRLTVETRRLDPDATYRFYTVGHPRAAEEPAETEPIRNGDTTYLVRPAEVLTAVEAIELFQHYYDHHAIREGWHLREQPEFATPADAGTAPVDKPAAGVSQDSASARPAAKTSTAAQRQAAVDKPKSRRQPGAQ